MSRTLPAPILARTQSSYIAARWSEERAGLLGARMSISVLEPDLSPTARLNDRMQGVAKALESWTRLKKREVPSDVWGYPPVISLVTKLDWEVLQLGHAVASRDHAGEAEVSEIERRLVEVETTISTLDGLLAGQSAPAGHYGYAI